MKKTVVLLFALLIFAAGAMCQEKGIDKTNERVRDTGADRESGRNGTKQDTGTGRGFDFGKGKTPATSRLDNPYRLTARRDAIIKAVAEVLREHKLTVDETASRPNDGIIISQPYTFIKGAVVSQSDLNRYAEVPDVGRGGWTRGRYTLTVEVQPIDAVTANVSVTAKVEGRSDSASGVEWTTLRSTGVAEDEFLAALVENVTGAPPPGRAPVTSGP